MRAAPLVSVVVPAWNAQATLDATLHSVRAQTHQALEIIVVDDGSTDGTRALAERHAAADMRVSVLHQANAGVAAARNAGWQRTSAAFIAFIDADDLWAPTKIERQLTVLQSADATVGLVYCWHSRIDDAGCIVGTSESPLHEGDVMEALVMTNFVGNGSAALIRREALTAARGFDSSLEARGAQGCEDYLLYLRIARSYRFALVPERLVGYRDLPHNMSSNRPRMLHSWQLVQREIISEQPRQASGMERSARDYAAWLAGDAMNRGAWTQLPALLLTLGRQQPAAALKLLFDPVLRQGARALLGRRGSGGALVEPGRPFL
jgi:glycosyltransferase involved in cell wall biosynthesis